MCVVNFPIEENDTFIVSYPKSGSTWMRHLLAKYLMRGIDGTIQDKIPGVYTTSKDHLETLKRPRYMKSHEPFTADYPRVIYIARDGRDVAISYYHFLKRYSTISPDMPFEDYLLQFHAGSFGSFFSVWSDHVHSWLDNMSPESLLVVRYEDLKANTVEQLLRCIEFLQQPIDRGLAVQAVADSRFEKLQSKEISNLAEDEEEKGLFFRKGEVNQWQSVYTPEMIQLFHLIHGSALQRLGYISADEHVDITSLSSETTQDMLRVMSYQQENYLALKQKYLSTRKRLITAKDELQKSQAPFDRFRRKRFWKLGERLQALARR